MSRKILLKRRDGTIQITGDWPKDLQPRDYVEFNDADGHLTAASLIEVTPRAYIYREILTPSLSRFSETFHPNQS